MSGKLSENPAAELIREIAETRLSGALRLVRERAKAVIYFDAGHLVLASSNLRAHRLREVLERRGFTAMQFGEVPGNASDKELAAALIKSGGLTAETLAVIRADQVSDILRVALLWIEGTWEFDPRVRLARGARVQINLSRLLLECGRHLPAGFVTSRLLETNGSYLQSANNLGDTALLPSEAFVISRATTAVNLSELTALSGLSEEEALPTIYALSLSGNLQRSDWPIVFGSGIPGTFGAPERAVTSGSPAPENGVEADAEEVDAEDVEIFFARLTAAKDYYEVLDVDRTATFVEIKSAYHDLARRFHPDRFHKSETGLRRRIDSAFARIAQAYEKLSDPSLRAGYDAKETSKSRKARRESAPRARRANGGPDQHAASETNRAEASFQRGVEAMQHNRHDEALRYLSEAATLLPRDARYRAHYGYALIRKSNTRRIAEGELQAAVALDPDNTSYRVMLAELYKALGLRRRAEGELERALAADPKNEAARALLLSLKSK
jgi:tetratricopeptide (TPR) repeat protein